MLGDTGTGKTLIAREFIHPSLQRSGPFVAVDLSTLPHELMAAHLFGVVKGAYTGATASREGVLARAHGGTLFLDEIGNLASSCKSSSCWCCRTAATRRSAVAEERVVDIKLVVATNENLATMVQAGRFREDLYMRLNPATACRAAVAARARGTISARCWRSSSLGSPRRPTTVICCRSTPHSAGCSLPEGGADDADHGRAQRAGPARCAPVHLLLHPTSFKLLREFEWPGNFRQFEMFLSNLVTLTLVELVDQAELVEPGDPSQASRPDVIPMLPRVVRDLLRPMELPKRAREGEPASARTAKVGLRIAVNVSARRSRSTRSSATSSASTWSGCTRNMMATSGVSRRRCWATPAPGARSSCG